MGNYEPPFKITAKIINLVSNISELVGKIHLDENMNFNPYLRKQNRIKTIHSSLAIENNTLSIEQITAIINGKRVLGLENEIKEVKNAFSAYEQILAFDPFNVQDLLKAHSIMMNSLVTEAGKFRTGGVGIFNGDKLIHLAPPAKFVKNHIENLLDWVKNNDMPMLVKSCVFHYEFEFIHPFQDGNGRMGRMWHTLLLSTYKTIFLYLPIETLIKEKQSEYYKVLAIADSSCDCSAFVEFLLQVIYDALIESSRDIKLPEKIQKLLSVLDYQPMSAKEIMQKLNISRNQTLRDSYLKPAMQLGLIAMTEPEHPNSRNQKYYKK